MNPIRIGCDDRNQPVTVDLTVRSRIALFGAPQSGKTTLCRTLGRRWIACHHGVCTVFSANPHEWANVEARINTSVEATGAPDDHAMLIVDDADGITVETLTGLLRAPYPVVLVASHEPLPLPVESSTGVSFVFWLTRAHRSVHTPLQPALDWPEDTIPVFLDRRRGADTPSHRWAV